MKVAIEKTDDITHKKIKTNKFSFIFFIKMPIKYYYAFCR